MKRMPNILRATAVLIIGLALSLSLPVMAWADSSTPSLVISQLKITSSNGQFITLYNSTDSALDMGKYQLEYFNSYDLGKATSSKLIALSGILPPHGYFMVNDSALLLCYQLTVDSVSLGLSSTAGMVEVLAFNQSNPGGSAVPVLQDYVGWSKTAAAGAQTLPSSTSAFLQRQPVDAANNPAVATAGAGNWQAVQPGSGNACDLVGAGSGGSVVPTGLSQLLPGDEPQATIIGQIDDTSGVQSSAGLPAADIGLMAPQITEILPNPTGTGNDATDEFIELYNPNAVSFDLTGFGLQVGTTALHSFTFPAGASLPAKGFTAFYSADTGLSLSNTSGQAKLLDPLGNSISATGAYDTAKDGYAWALAKGSWYWTTQPTPGAANVIKQPPATKKGASKTSSKSKASASKGKIKGAKAAKASSLTGSNFNSDTASVTPIHPWTLALVAGLALLYGAYEYRTDLANRIYQLRRYVKTRRAGRA
ncbi:MAG: lamin tail domain-containing protein [Candidatus Saccharimonadales bacterium]